MKLRSLEAVRAMMARGREFAEAQCAGGPWAALF